MGRHGTRRSRSPAGQRAEGVRWRTASPSGLNILQMLQSPQGPRQSLHESPALSDKARPGLLPAACVATLPVWPHGVSMRSCEPRHLSKP